MRTVQMIKEQNRLRKQYYIDFETENMLKNLHVLQTASFSSLIMLVILLLVTPFIISSWSVTEVYYFFIPAAMGFYLFTLFYQRRERKSHFVVYYACNLYCLALIAYIMVIDIYPYPESPSSFFPLLLLVLPVIFIFKSRNIFSITVLAEIVYILLISRVKTGLIAENDIFNSLVALLFSFVVSTIVTNLRIRDNTAKLNYQKLSAMDELTGIANKAACERRIAEAIRKKKYQGHSCLIVLDIDNFKGVNDTLGHQAGDAVLIQTGIVLRNLFLDRDIVGRIGGDEFMIFIYDIEGQEDVKDKCGQLLENIREGVLERLSMNITVSMGAVVFKEKPSFDSLFGLADRALYDAKRCGKGQFVLTAYKAKTTGEEPVGQRKV